MALLDLGQSAVHHPKHNHNLAIRVFQYSLEVLTAFSIWLSVTGNISGDTGNIVRCHRIILLSPASSLRRDYPFWEPISYVRHIAPSFCLHRFVRRLKTVAKSQ